VQPVVLSRLSDAGTRGETSEQETWKNAAGSASGREKKCAGTAGRSRRRSSHEHPGLAGRARSQPGANILRGPLVSPPESENETGNEKGHPAPDEPISSLMNVFVKKRMLHRGDCFQKD
jgi:hypothetical protein